MAVKVGHPLLDRRSTTDTQVCICIASTTDTAVVFFVVRDTTRGRERAYA